MKTLFDGVKEFGNDEFKKNSALFHHLSNKQAPHTLFISCSDSRVVPTMITKSNPGELFIIRNIANIIPFYRASSEYLATTSAIEYAVKVLNVKSIVICGHTDCGGCRAIYADDAFLDTIPHTKKWLKLAEPVKKRVERLQKKFGYDDIEWLVEQENVVLQINHLLTYPYVKERYRNKTLEIFGWYYDIGDGIVYNYNRKKRIFEKIE